MSWLDELKPGDKVIQHSQSGGEKWRWVSRTTKTQIIIGDDRFRRKNGYRIGDEGYYRTYLREWTQEWQDKRDMAQRIASLKEQITESIEDAPLEILERIYAILAESGGDEANQA